jgi:integrase
VENNSPITVNSYLAAADQQTQQYVNVNHTIGKLTEKFLYEKQTQGGWKNNIVTDNTSHINLFLEYFGDNIQVNDITRDNMVNFRENVLRKLPSNRNIRKETRGLSIKEQLLVPKIKRISTKTINGYLITLHSFFEWCIENLEILDKNPVRKLVLTEKENPNKKRKRYSDEDIKKIIIELSALKETKKLKVKNEDRIWITLLATF